MTHYKRRPSEFQGADFSDSAYAAPRPRRRVSGLTARLGALLIICGALAGATFLSAALAVSLFGGGAASLPASNLLSFAGVSDAHRVRAERMVIVSGHDTPTLWRGEKAVRTPRASTPDWGPSLIAAARRNSMPADIALETPFQTIELQKPALWSPYLASIAPIEDENGLNIETASIAAPVAAPFAAPPPRTRDGTGDPRFPLRRTFVDPLEAAFEAELNRQTRGAPTATVSIVLTAFGVNAAASRRALDLLPPEIAVAVAPIADDPERWVEDAKADGRLVLLETPMEPQGYPRVDPGPLTLLTSLSAEDNVDRFRQILDMAPNVDGVATYLGDSFVQDVAALTPLMRDWSRRGLVVFENGDGRRSRIKDVANDFGVPTLRRSVSIDQGGRRRNIKEGLGALERAARRNGYAVGVGVATPSTIQGLLAWVSTLDEQGVRLASPRL